MTVPPPEPPAGAEPPGRDRRSSEPSDSEVDTTFAALVAGWDGARPAWPAAPEPAAAEPAAPEPAPVEAPEPVEEDEGHYDPPEPPPVPAPHRATVGALVLIVIGLFLLLVPGVIGLTSSTGFPLGLLSVTGGLTWLLARLRPGPPPDSGWDDGAQL